MTGAVGVDLHKRLPLMESNASTGGSRSRDLFSFPPPRALSSTKNNANLSNAKAMDLHSSGKPKEEKTSM